MWPSSPPALSSWDVSPPRKMRPSPLILLVSSGYGVLVSCKFPAVIIYTELFFLLSLVVLFGNFYVQSYIKRKRHLGTKTSKPAAITDADKEIKRKQQ